MVFGRDTPTAGSVLVAGSWPGPLAGEFAGDIDPGLDVEFGEDMGDVGLDGVARQVEFCGDVGAGLARRYEVRDLELGCGQGVPGGDRAVARAAADAEGAQQRIGAPGGPDGVAILGNPDGTGGGG